MGIQKPSIPVVPTAGCTGGVRPLSKSDGSRFRTPSLIPMQTEAVLPDVELPATSSWQQTLAMCSGRSSVVTGLATADVAAAAAAAAAGWLLLLLLLLLLLPPFGKQAVCLTVFFGGQCRQLFGDSCTAPEWQSPESGRND